MHYLAKFVPFYILWCVNYWTGLNKSLKYMIMYRFYLIFFSIVLWSLFVQRTALPSHGIA